MAKDAEPTPEDSAEESDAPKGRSSLIWIGITAGASILSAAGTFFVVSSTLSPATDDAEHEAQAAEEEHAGEESAEDSGSSEHSEGSADAHAEESDHGPAPSKKSSGRAKSSSSSSHSSVASGDGAELATIFELETFVVNINDGDRDRFLKIKPELEISDSAVSDELKSRMPQVKDIVISLLSSQSFNQIRSIEGKDALREDLMIRLNALVREGKVIRVFFTEFVVQ